MPRLGMRSAISATCEDIGSIAEGGRGRVNALARVRWVFSYIGGSALLSRRAGPGRLLDPHL